jgi:hypothetical protein
MRTAERDQTDLAADAGTHYLIAVAASSPEREGSFDLRVFDPLASPPAAGAFPPPPPGAAPKAHFSLKRALKKCRKIKRAKRRRRCVHRARRRARRLGA